jgi:hypothetical protein
MELLIGIGFGTAIGGFLSYGCFLFWKDAQVENKKLLPGDNDTFDFTGIRSGKPKMFEEEHIDENDTPLLHEVFPEILHWQMGDKIDIRENSSLHSKPIGLIFNGVNDDQNMVFTDHNGHIKLYREISFEEYKQRGGYNSFAHDRKTIQESNEVLVSLENSNYQYLLETLKTQLLFLQKGVH